MYALPEVVSYRSNKDKKRQGRDIQQQMYRLRRMFQGLPDSRNLHQAGRLRTARRLQVPHRSGSCNFHRTVSKRCEDFADLRLSEENRLHPHLRGRARCVVPQRTVQAVYDRARGCRNFHFAILPCYSKTYTGQIPVACAQHNPPCSTVGHSIGSNPPATR